MPDTIFLLTGRSIERLLDEGGSQAWRLDAPHAREMRYAICCQNRYPPSKDGFYAGTAPHRSAFLVAKVSGVVPARSLRPEDQTSGPRWLVTFSEWAKIDPPIPEAWPGGRNPVRYGDLSDLGIDPDQLDWQPMPPAMGNDRARTGAADQAVPSNDGMDHQSLRKLIASEKLKLSRITGVSPDAIEITIRF